MGIWHNDSTISHINTSFIATNTSSLAISKNNSLRTPYGTQEGRVVDGKYYYFEIEINSWNSYTYFGLSNSNTSFNTDTLVRFYLTTQGSSTTGLKAGILLDLKNKRFITTHNGTSWSGWENFSYWVKSANNWSIVYLSAIVVNSDSTIDMKFNTGSEGFFFDLKPPSDVTEPIYSFDGALKYYDKIERSFLKTDKQEFVYLDENNNWKTLNREPTEEDYINYGVDISSIPNKKWEELSENVQVYFFTSDVLVENTVIKKTTEPYSVYDYISENPQAIIYTESTDDITISTTTEPYDLYDEFGDEVEVLYYTDDKSVTEADLVLEANWSPIDELEGDFEIVTWTDEAQEDAQRVLEMVAIPKPQFVKTVAPKRLYGYLDSVLAVDNSTAYRDEVRYLFANRDSSKWYTWDFEQNKFKQVEVSTHELIQLNGMKHTDIKKLSQDSWRMWNDEYMNIGIFLKDNPRDTIISSVDSVSYQDYLPTSTSTISNASLYILNTTAKIDIELNGNILKGFLSDDDLTRVQYRVLLNGNNYYPTDGSFSNLGESPQNIELIIGSKDIKIDDWNTLKVEFQDFFGTTDYWSTQFIGTYSGIMFKDVYGQYYSSEIGEVLQYLDFGIIIAGQTTLENEIVLKNQYGYDVENIHLYANNANLPDGMTIEFSESQTPFSPQPELRLSRVLANNEEMSFFVRLKTTLGATPDANGSFDIIVKADKVQ